MIGKIAGLAVIGELFVAIIRKQPRHARILFEERADEIGMQQRVDLAVGQHLLDGSVMRQAHDLEPRGAVEIDRLVELAEPLDGFERHAVFVLENAAQPDQRGRLKLLEADLASGQVGRLADAFRRIDEHEAVAEAAMQKHRNRVDRHALIARDEIG